MELFQHNDGTVWEVVMENIIQILIISAAVYFIIRFVRKKHDDVE